jgi:hypothetical protein
MRCKKQIPTPNDQLLSGSKSATMFDPLTAHDNEALIGEKHWLAPAGNPHRVRLRRRRGTSTLSASGEGKRLHWLVLCVTCFRIPIIHPV